jgi:hypothetical protein
MSLYIVYYGLTVSLMKSKWISYMYYMYCTLTKLHCHRNFIELLLFYTVNIVDALCIEARHA